MNTNLTIIIIVHLEKLIYFAGMNGKPSNVTETSVSNELFFSGVEQLLAEGKSVRIKAKGRSMEPFIRDGRDEIVLAAGIQARKGCIILAKTGEGIVLHRVINIEGNAVTLMGDGNLYKTESCLREDITKYGAVMTISAVCLMYVDLPPMFGPVIRRMFS